MSSSVGISIISKSSVDDELSSSRARSASHAPRGVKDGVCSCEQVSPPQDSTEGKEGSEKVKEELWVSAPRSPAGPTLPHASSEGSGALSSSVDLLCVSVDGSPASLTIPHASSEGSGALSVVVVTFCVPGSTQAPCGVRGGTKVSSVSSDVSAAGGNIACKGVIDACGYDLVVRPARKSRKPTSKSL